MLIGLTGGIGSGKSMVSRILRLRGYAVYDCDIEARRLMQSSPQIRQALSDRWGRDIYREDGTLDRKRVAGYVFADDAERLWLNSMTHRMVHDDVLQWHERGIRCCCGDEDIVKPVFVESAILFTSGLDKICDDIWLVDAPDDVRLCRILMRGGNIREAEARKRMVSQHEEMVLQKSSAADIFIIENDDRRPILPQIDDALMRINKNE